MAASLIRVAAAGRSYPGETESGDGWTLHRHGEVYRIAVIDGLGHGPAAAAATDFARRWLDAHPAAPPVEALRGCHQALLDCRGAVMAVAGIDLASQRISFAGVGNVEARLIQPGRSQHLVSFRGIVGVRLPTLRPVEISLDSPWAVVLHTDGVSARFDLSPDRLWLGVDELESLAGEILARWGRGTDDATVVIASYGGRPAS